MRRQRNAVAGERPLSDVKVLDLTRIIAGPVCGRTLAAHGADVLLVTAKHLASMLPLVMDTGRGKLSASIDLRDANGRERWRDWSRRPTCSCRVIGLAPSPRTVSRRRTSPACGRGSSMPRCAPTDTTGPWASRRGFDSLVQTASGFNLAEAEAFGSPTPKELPAQELDHATGYLLAFAVMTALKRRPKRAVHGMCAFRSRKPATGCGNSAASMA